MQYTYTEPMLSKKGAQLRNLLVKYLDIFSHRLPDDVTKKLVEYSKIEVDPLQKIVYDTMMENQRLAAEADVPSCQDTGTLQFFVKVGTKFPLIDELNEILVDATYQATKIAPLRTNAVQTFDEYNTNINIGDGIPGIFTQLVPHSSDIEIYPYMAGGGCTLPGVAKVLMPGEGYEGVTRFVMDRMTTYGVNACPPLLVGVGIGSSDGLTHTAPISGLPRWNTCWKTGLMRLAWVPRASAARNPLWASTSLILPATHR